ncbi:glutamine amidotransferase [Mesorhizobium sp. BR1-1-16]|uniref:glutamine amidotransferase n=1 Tax=Mesorhizobium sp. BR1-1-16 TaxID=2876653 RepID=UPI001CCC2CF2|nr:glutamine amidotransferase [Mesorhizobium sp. BR1-1-16]MBZ9935990.1 glutamine amidotransferase [Mesorhizobium sp. BR1-1-16]
MKPVLLAGETFHITSLAAKGYEVGASSRYSNGAERYLAAMDRAGILVTQIGGERCEAEFPTSLAALSAYSVVVLSDVGALSLLYTPETRAGRRSVNRLELLRQWVEAGGSLMMAGGYTSFQGMDGMALFHGTPVEACLPVECLPGPDGLEMPEGFDPVLASPDHPVLDGITGPIPYVLGLNRVVPHEPSIAETLIHGSHHGATLPLLSVRTYGAGRTLAWMTDIGPHWLSREFLDWLGYDRLITNMVRWLAREI